MAEGQKTSTLEALKEGDHDEKGCQLTTDNYTSVISPPATVSCHSKGKTVTPNRRQKSTQILPFPCTFTSIILLIVNKAVATKRTLRKT